MKVRIPRPELPKEVHNSPGNLQVQQCRTGYKGEFRGY